MTIIGGDGFDMYNGTATDIGLQSKWTLLQNVSTSMIAGRFGGQAVRLTDGTGGGVMSRISHNLGTGYSSMSIGFAFRRSTNCSGDPLILNELNNANQQLRVTHGGSGAPYFSVQRGDGTVLIPAGPFATVSGQWCYVEIVFTIANSGGTVELFVNGVSQGSFTGDTQQQTNNTVGHVEFRSPDETGSGNPFDFDDVYFKDDTTPLGEIRIATLRAIADTADADFTPVGASPNYNCIDETLVDGDTTYVQGSNSGDLDLYEYEDVPGDPSAIYGVQLVTFARKTDVGARTLTTAIKSGATLDSSGTPPALATTYDRYDRMIPLDPDGSIPWTKTTVDAALVGPLIP